MTTYTCWYDGGRHSECIDAETAQEAANAFANPGYPGAEVHVRAPDGSEEVLVPDGGEG